MLSRKEFITDCLISNTDNCLIWPFAVRKSSGYGAHNFYANGGKTNVDAHRHVCKLAHGIAPTNKHQAAHSCGNKLCCNPNHLRWAVQLANMEDAKAHNVLPGGGRGMYKLTESIVHEIRNSEMSLLKIANKYGIGVSYASKVRRGLAWAS